MTSNAYHPGVHTLIEENQDALAELCRKHHVRSLECSAHLDLGRRALCTEVTIVTTS